MLILLNLFILLYLLAMVVVWGKYGFFSALLHLIITLVAGAVAFALWEPLAFNVFSSSGRMIAGFALGLGLLVPFIVTLLIMRMVVDYFIRGNVILKPTYNLIGGGLLGLFSGLVTAGVLVLGVSFLPVGESLMGYKPLRVQGGGVASTGDDLWVGVDDFAGWLYGGLSQGAFSTSEPLGEMRPYLVREAAAGRLRPTTPSGVLDSFAPIAAPPGSVEVTGAFVVEAGKELPPALDPSVVDALDRFKSGRYDLVVVDTRWPADKGAVARDGFGTLRLAPAQVALITRGRSQDVAAQEESRKGLKLGEGVETVPNFHPPAGVGQNEPGRKGNVFTPITDRADSIYGTANIELAFAFLIPKGETPVSLWVRNTRLDLPAKLEPTPETAAGLGRYTPREQAVASGDGTTTGPDGGPVAVDPATGATGHEASALEFTNALPVRISVNQSTALGRTEVAGTKVWAITDGDAAVAKTAVNSSAQGLDFTVLFKPSHLAMARLQVHGRQMKSLLGRAMEKASNVAAGVYLELGDGTTTNPVAYVWIKSDGSAYVYYRGDTPIQQAGRLPLEQMSRDDQLYLYFYVPHGAEVVRYHIGNESQEIGAVAP